MVSFVKKQYFDSDSGESELKQHVNCPFCSSKAMVTQAQDRIQAWTYGGYVFNLKPFLFLFQE